MTIFTLNIINIIKSIPAGRVMTYGKVATLAGNPKGARQVSWVLKTQTAKHHLPWHRIIGKDGKIKIKDYESSFIQRSLLEAEGIKFDLKGKIDLNTYEWNDSF